MASIESSFVQENNIMKKFLLPALALLLISGTANATTGKGCLRVVNVTSWDTLNVRARPSASSPIVGEIDPNNYGVISLRGTCAPKNVSWGNRWCPVVSYYDNSRVRGWVRAKFVRDSECP
jgi:Bacterial SH3 domain